MKKSEVLFHGFPEKAAKLLKRSAAAVLNAEHGDKKCEISVALVSDAEIKKLNKKYLGRDRITDVISFRLTEKPLCGDIYIARGRSKKQAKEAGSAWEAELCYLTLHGLLHRLIQRR